jgi:hypothetical protein
MSLTYASAVDDILDLLKAAWDPTGYELYFENTRGANETAQNPWAETILRHAAGQQDTLGGVGQRQFLRTGVLITTIHVPYATGLQSAYALAKMIADAYEGVSSPNGVWFRNVRVNEQDRDGSFYRVNVLVDFEYHETK